MRLAVSALKPSDFPDDKLPEIAFVGRSNVGKSSVINCLLKVDIARTSSTPGKTRAINFYRVDDAFYFVDLPGYGYAKVPKFVKRSWRSLIESYLGRRPNLLLSVLVVDARCGLTELDTQMRRWLEHHRVPYVVVATKADKAVPGQLRKVEAELRSELGSERAIIYSAVTGIGNAELWHRIQAGLRSSGSRGQNTEPIRCQG